MPPLSDATATSRPGRSPQFEVVQDRVCGPRIISGPVTEPEGVPHSRLRAVATDPARTAAAAFVVVEIVGFVFYVIAAGKIWFFRDDWDFLAGRGLNVSDLLRQHGGHLVALPLVVFRVMYDVVGLRSYLPYQVLPIALHLTAAALLRAVMRRAGVSPWVATVAATLFVFFGAGSQDIIWAFQITFSGPLVLGLGQLLLADHDGPLDRRDWIGLGLGFAALLCSGVAIAMIGVVGLATLLRRGWRIALFHIGPLAIVYVAWYLHYAGSAAHVSDLSVLVDWLRTGAGAVFDALAQVPFVGWALALMLVVGLVLAWRGYDDGTQRRRQGAAVAAMLVGAFGFLLISGINRAVFGTQFAASSRYLHIVAALLLPALAVAGDALIRLRRAFAPVVFALFLVGLPGNIGDTGDSFSPHHFFVNYEQTMRSLPRTPLASQVPKDLRPELVNAPVITIGWLLEAAHSGRLAAPRASTVREAATDRLRLSLEQLDEGNGTNCRRIEKPFFRRVAVGGSFIVRGTVSVQLVDPTNGKTSDVVNFGATFFTGGHDHTIRNVSGDPLTIRVVPHGASFCEVAG
jgi:hypothetical protein